MTSGGDIAAGAVKVTKSSRRGERKIAADKFGGEARDRTDKIGGESMEKGGGGWGPETAVMVRDKLRGMKVADREESMMRVGRRRKVDLPKIRGGGFGASEEGRRGGRRGVK